VFAEFEVEVRFLTPIQQREDGLLTGTAKRKGLVGQIVNLSNIDTGLEKTDFYMVLLLRFLKAVGPDFAIECVHTNTQDLGREFLVPIHRTQNTLHVRFLNIDQRDR